MTPKAVEIVGTTISSYPKLCGFNLVGALLRAQYIPKSANAHIKQT
jgi:hypothetical protein